MSIGETNQTPYGGDDLIKRLREGDLGYGEAAADHIEKLEGQCVVYAKWDRTRVDYINDLEAKLAKAMEGLRFISQMHGYTSRQLSDLARTALAELEGEDVG